MRRVPHPRVLLPALVTAALLAGASPAAAVTITVTTKTDENDTAASTCLPPDQDCSLREAIKRANTLPSDDTVVVPAGVYSIALANLSADENANASGDFDVLPNGKLTLAGVGARATIVNGAGLDRVLDVRPQAKLELSGVSITGGLAQLGGGIRVDGGGLAPPATLTTSAVTISGNSAHTAGTNLGQGGGIYATANSDVTLTATTVSSNSADQAGGGIFNEPTGCGGCTAALKLTNATLAGNQQTQAQAVNPLDYGGGAIANYGDLTLLHVTIANNFASAGGGGVQQKAGTANSKSSIVSGNTSTTPATATNCDGALTSQGYNLELGTTCGFTDGTDVHADPKLAPLADYGGPTNTKLPRAGSAAIDAATTTGCPAADQRGVTRPQGTLCDIGAVEVAATNIGITMTDSPDPVANGAQLVYKIKVHNFGTQTANGVVVTDNLPAGVTVIATDVGGEDCTGGQTRTCVIGNIAAGQDAFVTITVRVQTTGSISNTATVTSETPDTTAGNNTATVSTAITLRHGRCANVRYGTAASETLNGTAQGDAISGRGGNDRLFGNRGEDCLYGGIGNDLLDGGRGNDFLFGGRGGDTLRGRLGDDRFRGQDGPDHIFARDGNSESVDCGSGHDTAVVDFSDHVTGCESVSRG